MSEQEQRALEILDTFELRRKTKKYNKLDLNDVYASQIALNLILKLQEENKELREGKNTAENELKSQLEENKKLQADIEITDKVIDLMAEDIRQVIGDDNYMEMTRDETIEKYYREVEEENNETN